MPCACACQSVATGVSIFSTSFRSVFDAPGSRVTDSDTVRNPRTGTRFLYSLSPVAARGIANPGHAAENPTQTYHPAPPAPAGAGRHRRGMAGGARRRNLPHRARAAAPGTAAPTSDVRRAVIHTRGLLWGAASRGPLGAPPGYDRPRSASTACGLDRGEAQPMIPPPASATCLATCVVLVSVVLRICVVPVTRPVKLR